MMGATGVTNSILRSRALPTGRSAPAILFAATCIVWIGPAKAAVDLSAGATVGIEHNTNPIQLSNGEAPPFAASGNADRDDTSRQLTANLAAVAGGAGPIQLQLQASFSHVENDRLDTMNHSEYSVGGNLDWKSSQVFDVSLQASQNRAPVGLADVGGEKVTQLTAGQAQGTLRLRPVPSWQISLSPGWNRLELPLPDAPDFQLRATTGSASLDFLGAGLLIPGLSVNESRGTYSGIDNATRYRQRTVQGTLNYQATGLSTFTLAAGHTQRTTHLRIPSSDPVALANEGRNSAFTGRVSYKRQLSVKTGINVSAYRDFQQYDGGVNTTVGTGFNVGVTWVPTVKLSVALDSSFVWSTINGLRIAETVGQRKDLVRSHSLSVDYLAARRVSLRTYVVRIMRTSGDSADQFNGTTVGMQLTARVD
jgi:hypothetical protein